MAVLNEEQARACMHKLNGGMRPLIAYRNRTSAGHIITIEEPVEDTHPWHHALKNTLRQAPGARCRT